MQQHQHKEPTGALHNRDGLEVLTQHEKEVKILTEEELRLNWANVYDGMLALVLRTLRDLQEASKLNHPGETLRALKQMQHNFEVQVPWVLLFNPNLSESDIRRFNSAGLLPTVPEVRALLPNLKHGFLGHVGQRYRLIIPGPIRILEWDGIHIGGRTIDRLLDYILRLERDANELLIRSGCLQLPPVTKQQ